MLKVILLVFALSPKRAVASTRAIFMSFNNGARPVRSFKKSVVESEGVPWDAAGGILERAVR